MSVALLIGIVAKWLIYTSLLWVMIKVQKLNYSLLGLFGSSLAATLVNLIPIVGPYVSYVVLILCLWKCTGADIAPDIMFTVTIAGALMFCINLWLLGALLGDLRPSEKISARTQATADADDADTDEPPAEAKPATPVPAEISTRKFILKGVVVMPERQLAMIQYADHVHSLEVGEGFTVPSPEGPIQVRCEKVTRSTVTLSTSDGQRAVLRVR